MQVNYNAHQRCRTCARITRCHGQRDGFTALLREVKWVMRGAQRCACLPEIVLSCQSRAHAHTLWVDGLSQ